MKKKKSKRKRKMQSLDTLTASFKKFKEDFVKEASKVLTTELKSFFQDHPEVQALRWSQYTPYFNDGDECTFSVHGLYWQPSDKEVAEDDTDYGDAFLSTYNDTYASKKLQKEIQTLEGLLCSSEMEDILRSLYGDHVQVTVTKDDVEVEDYEHD